MRTNQRERANIGGGSNGETHTGRGQAHAGDADRRCSTAGRRLYPGWPRELRRSEPWREQRHGGRLLALRQLGSSLVASGPAVGSPSPGPTNETPGGTSGSTSGRLMQAPTFRLSILWPLRARTTIRAVVQPG